MTIGGANIAPDANGVYTLSEGTVEEKTYTSDDLGIEVTALIVTSDTAKFIRDDGWYVGAYFSDYPLTWAITDPDGNDIYWNQTTMNGQRGGFYGSSGHVPSGGGGDDVKGVLSIRTIE